MDHSRPNPGPSPGSESGPGCEPEGKDQPKDSSLELKRRKLSGASCASEKSNNSKQAIINFQRDSESSRSGTSSQDLIKGDPQDHQRSGEGDCTISTVTPFDSSLKTRLQQRFRCVFEGTVLAGSPAHLDQIYTELYITGGETSEVNQEHEVQHIETCSRRPAGTTITCEDIFKGRAHTQGPIRVVLTKGVAGVGKTVLTQKFSLDWAEGQANQDVQLLFPFTFRELNLLSDCQLSLVDLLHRFYGESTQLSNLQHHKVVFIFDGLDESRLPLDFTQTRVLTNPTKSSSMDVLLVNLIRGDLLPSANLWVTTRPAAACRIPAQFVSMVTEVRGFTDPQKDQYFRKRFTDKDQASAVISHIRTSRSLHSMCYIPVFCWIISTVLENIITNTGNLPKTLTDLYIHFLVIQAKMKGLKYDRQSETAPSWSPETRRMVESLGRLAFEQLQKGNVIFYESDLSECGLDAAEASVYSGVFTQIFREESGLYQDKVYCFIHLSIQEFLAALHVHLTFYNSGVNLMSPNTTSLDTAFYWSAVDQALQSPNGHLDLFLRFLLGLSLPTNQSLLQGLQTQRGSSSLTQEIEKYIREKLNESLSADRSLNLFHCLNELKDRSLVEDIQRNMREGHLSFRNMSPVQWSALAFLLLSSDSNLDEFNLSRYYPSERVLLQLLPVVKVCSKANLSSCHLSQSSCGPLSSILCSSSLTQLELSYNNLQDSGLELLCSGLKSTSCRLEVLSLRVCGLSQSSCGPLSSILCSSRLTHLDLSNNDLQDSGLELLCSGLKSTPYRLEVLSLSWCHLSQRSCGPLSSVLCSSRLTHLDLSNNDLQDSGVELLCSGLKSTPCRLEVLRLSGCLVSETGVAYLASALSSASSRLRELDLSYNYPGPSAELLTNLRDDPHCPLDSVRLVPAGERWLVPGPRKYFCEFCLDPSTAHSELRLSEDKLSVTRDPDQSVDWAQVAGATGLTGRCYWEVQWSREWVSIAVSRADRCVQGNRSDLFGRDAGSWSLRIEAGHFSVHHDNRVTHLLSSSGILSGRVGVLLDSEAGQLSFYTVDSVTLCHLHTCLTCPSEPLVPGFGLWPGSTVSLVQPRPLLDTDYTFN